MLLKLQRSKNLIIVLAQMAQEVANAAAVSQALVECGDDWHEQCLAMILNCRLPIAQINLDFALVLEEEEANDWEKVDQNECENGWNKRQFNLDLKNTDRWEWSSVRSASLIGWHYTVSPLDAPDPSGAPSRSRSGKRTQWGNISTWQSDTVVS